MNILFLMIPVTFCLVGLFSYLFIRAAQTGQFDDLSTAAHRIFFDDYENQQSKERGIHHEPSDS